MGPQGPAGGGGGAQLRFITGPTNIPAGQQQVAFDMFIIDTLTIDAPNASYFIGTTVSNDGLLNIKTNMTIAGTLNVLGLLVFD